MFPPRHALGAILLQAGRPDEAETVYWEDLRRNRESGWALFGLHQALVRAEEDRRGGAREGAARQGVGPRRREADGVALRPAGDGGQAGRAGGELTLAPSPRRCHRPVSIRYRRGVRGAPSPSGSRGGLMRGGPFPRRLARCLGVALAAVLASSASAQPAPPVRLSVRTDGTQSDHPSTLLGASADGRHVLFSSNGNLVAEDVNGVIDLFVRDRDTDADGVLDEPGAVRTLLTSIGPTGRQLGPLPPDIGVFTGGTLSQDGRFVFFSTRWPLVENDTNDVADGYLYDRDADADGIFDEPGAAGLSLVTTGSGNALATGGASSILQVTADGRYVLFSSLATNLQPRPASATQIYRKDRLTTVTTLVSSMSDGTPAEGFVNAAMSPDGHLVTLAGGFPALWPGPSSSQTSYPWVLRDLDTNGFTPIPLPTAGPSVLPATGASGGLHAAVSVPYVTASVGFSPDGQRAYLEEGTQFLGATVGRSGTTLEYDIATGRVIRRLPGITESTLAGFRDGHTFSLTGSVSFFTTSNAFDIRRFDRSTGRDTTMVAGQVCGGFDSAAGRTLYYGPFCTGAPGPPLLLDARYGVPLTMPEPVRLGVLDAAGATVFFSSNEAAILPGGADTNGVSDVFAVDLLSRLDRDADGLDDRWEAAMGLDYTSGAGANGGSGDPDADGFTNLQEQTAGSHPGGAARQFLAEGADNAFFKTRLAIANPGATAATAVVRLDGDDGTTKSVNVHVPAGARRSVFVDEIEGHAPSFSTTVESSVPLVSERTMSWDATEYGAHAERASAAPSSQWFLAEGATGAFSLFYLLQNPGDTAATATIRYLRPAPLAPIDRVYTLPPHSRTTLPVDQQAPELASTDVSASITATQPILVERAMYRSIPGQPFAAGHASAGVTAPATSWFLAEGATGPFFDLFVLVANPSPTDAIVEIRYLLTGGTALTKTYTVAHESRRTIYVDAEDFPGLGQALASVDVSCVITSTNAVPIVVERSMWFPGPAISPVFWTEANNSPGATATARRWVLADGEVGGTRAAQTYVLIANTASTAGRARVTLLNDQPTTTAPFSAAPLTVTVDLPPHSRTTVPMQAIPGILPRFGVIVESIDTTPLADLVVERAMYWNSGGVTWTAGTNLLATPVP